MLGPCSGDQVRLSARAAWTDSLGKKTDLGLLNTVGSPDLCPNFIHPGSAEGQALLARPGQVIWETLSYGQKKKKVAHIWERCINSPPWVLTLGFPLVNHGRPLPPS